MCAAQGQAGLQRKDPEHDCSTSVLARWSQKGLQQVSSMAHTNGAELVESALLRNANSCSSVSEQNTAVPVEDHVAHISQTPALHHAAAMLTCAAELATQHDAEPMPGQCCRHRHHICTGQRRRASSAILELDDGVCHMLCDALRSSVSLHPNAAHQSAAPMQAVSLPDGRAISRRYVNSCTTSSSSSISISSTSSSPRHGSFSSRLSSSASLLHQSACHQPHSFPAPGRQAPDQVPALISTDADVLYDIQSQHQLGPSSTISMQQGFGDIDCCRRDSHALPGAWRKHHHTPGDESPNSQLDSSHNLHTGYHGDVGVHHGSTVTHHLHIPMLNVKPVLRSASSTGVGSGRLQGSAVDGQQQSCLQQLHDKPVSHSNRCELSGWTSKAEAIKLQITHDIALLYQQVQACAARHSMLQRILKNLHQSEGTQNTPNKLRSVIQLTAHTACLLYGCYITVENTDVVEVHLITCC